MIKMFKKKKNWYDIYFKILYPYKKYTAIFVQDFETAITISFTILRF